MTPEIYEWLGKWEEPVYFGKHDKWEPVYVIGGYLYSKDRNGNLLSVPWTAGKSSPVDRWGQSPQVRFWMDEPRKPFLTRLAGKIGGWLRTGRWER